MPQRTILSILMFIVIGCRSSREVTTELTSFVDPAYQKVSYERFVIEVDYSDIRTKDYFERSITETLLDSGVFAVPDVVLFPPTRSFTHEERFAIMIDLEFDVYLLVSETDAGAVAIKIPETTSSTTKGYASETRYGVLYGESSSTTTTGGGYISIPWADMSASLYDLRTGDRSWVASARSVGRSRSTGRDLIDAFSKKLADAISKAGLLQKQPFVATRDTERYHRFGCNTLTRENARVPISAASEAIFADFEPCSICKPPTFSSIIESFHKEQEEAK